MTKFVLLCIGGSMPENEAESAKVLKAWEAWYASLGSAVVDRGNPLNFAKKVASNGALSNGANISMVNGYIILEADSLDKAVKMAQTCPVLQGGSEISVFEAFSGM
jgi:hypothetical protein